MLAGGDHGETPPRWLVPRREWRLGQSDKTSAACLWALLGGVCAYLVFALSLLLVQAPPGAPVLAAIVPVVLVSVVGVVTMVRSLSAGRWAWYGRLAQRLRRSHLSVRVRVLDPPLRVLGVPVVHGRRGTCVVATDRVVIVVRRVHPLAAFLTLAAGCRGLPEMVGHPVGVFASALLILIGSALFLLSGADVHEIRFDEIEHVDAEDGHVRWTQNGPDAPRVLRLRITHPDDPGASSPWLGGAGASGDPG